MATNHLGGTLSEITNEPLGYITAATAFIMLSGYMYALTAISKAPTFKSLVAQACTRAAKIYRYHIGLFILLLLPTLFSSVYKGYLGYLYTSDGSIFTSIAYAALLLHQPPFMHILPLYIVMSLVSPLILMALHRGYDWLVITASLTIWVIGQFYDPLKWLIAITDSSAAAAQFNLFGWQVLWVTGIYIGFLHHVRKRTIFFAHPAYLYFAIAGATAFFLTKHHFIVPPVSVEFYFENSDFRLLRFINTISQVVIFCYVIKKVPTNLGLPWFRFLGRYSLQVFSYHVLIVCLLAPISWRIGPRYGLTADLVYTLLVVASMTVPGLIYFAYESYQRENNAYPPWRRRAVAIKALGTRFFMTASKSR